MADEQYDFSDWQLGQEGEETLRKLVRGQLQALQAWQRITAGWRAALNAVDEEATRLLDLPPKE